MSAALAKTDQDKLCTPQGFYQTVGEWADWFTSTTVSENGLISRSIETLSNAKQLITEWFTLFWTTVKNACRDAYGAVKSATIAIQAIFMEFVRKCQSYEFPTIRAWIKRVKAMWNGTMEPEDIRSDDPNEISTFKKSRTFIDDYLNTVEPLTDELYNGIEVQSQGLDKVKSEVYDTIVEVFSFFVEVFGKIVAELMEFKNLSVVGIKNFASLYFTAERFDIVGACKRLVNYIVSWIDPKWRPFADQAARTDFFELADGFTERARVLTDAKAKLREKDIEEFRKESQLICDLCKKLTLCFPREAAYFNSQYKHFLALYRQATGKYCSGQPRIKPVTVVLFGPSNTGKSTAINMIADNVDKYIWEKASDVLEKLGESKPSSRGKADKFSVNCIEEKAEFDAGVNDPRFFELNELYTSINTTANNDWSNYFFNLAGDNPMMLNTPFEDKGTKYFLSPFLFATGNATKHIAPMKDLDAYFRRIDLDLRVSRKTGGKPVFKLSDESIRIITDADLAPHSTFVGMSSADVKALEFTLEQVIVLIGDIYIERRTTPPKVSPEIDVDDLMSVSFSFKKAPVKKTIKKGKGKLVEKQGLESDKKETDVVQRAQDIVRLLKIGNVIYNLPSVAISKSAFLSYINKIHTYTEYMECKSAADENLPKFTHTSGEHGFFDYALDMRWFRPFGEACSEFVDGNGTGSYPPPKLAHNVKLMLARLRDDWKNFTEFNGPNKWSRRHAERDYIAKVVFPSLSVDQKRVAALAAQDPNKPGSGWLPFNAGDVQRAQRQRHALYNAHKQRATDNAQRVREQTKEKNRLQRLEKMENMSDIPTMMSPVKGKVPKRGHRGKGMKGAGVRNARRNKEMAKGYVERHGIGRNSSKMGVMVRNMGLLLTQYPNFHEGVFREDTWYEKINPWYDPRAWYRDQVKTPVDMYWYLRYLNVDEETAIRFAALVRTTENAMLNNVSLKVVERIIDENIMDAETVVAPTGIEMLIFYGVICRYRGEHMSPFNEEMFFQVAELEATEENLIRYIHDRLFHFFEPNSDIIAYGEYTRFYGTFIEEKSLAECPIIGKFVNVFTKFNKFAQEYAKQGNRGKFMDLSIYYLPTILWTVTGILAVAITIDAIITVGMKVAKWMGYKSDPLVVNPDDPMVEKILAEHGVTMQGDAEYEKRKAERLAKKNLALKIQNQRVGQDLVKKQGADMEGFNSKILRNAYVCLTHNEGALAGNLLFLKGTLAVMNLHVYESLDALQLVCYTNHIGANPIIQMHTNMMKVIHKVEERDLVFLNVPSMRNHADISGSLQSEKHFGFDPDAAWVAMFDANVCLGLTEPISNFVSNSQETLRDQETRKSILLKSTYTWQNAAPGRCGTAVCVTRSGRCWIEGLHSFGMQKKKLGVCYPIFRSDFDQAVKRLRQLPGSDGYEVALSDSEKGVYDFDVQRQCYTTPVIKDACGQTCFVPTPFTDLEFNGGPPKIPANLTVKAYTLALAKEKVTYDNPQLHEEVHDIITFASKEIMHKFLPVNLPVIGKCSTLSVDEALFSEEIDLNSFDFKTAEGIRCQLAHIPKKAAADPDSEAAQAIRDIVNEKVRAFEQGEFTLQLNSDCLKDEPRDLDRVKAMKTRLFNVTDFIDNILIKMALGALVAKFKKLLTHGPSMCGINPGCNMWSYIYALFIGRDLVCSDFSGWDHLSEKWIGMLVYPWLEMFYGKGTFASRFACWAYLGATQAIRFNKGIGRRLDRGGSSGNWGTTFFNTINNHVMHCITLISLSLQNGYDWRLALADFRHVLYSDDNISSGPKFWTPGNVAREMKRLFGANLTGTDKGSLGDQCIKLHEADFLCRSFRKRNGVVYCPLSLDSLLSQLYYVRTTKSTRSRMHILYQLQINLDNVSRELLEYPEEEAYAIAKSIQDFINDNCLSLTFDWSNLDSANKRLMY